MTVLACPESCQYLQDARAQSAERESALRSKDVAYIKTSEQITQRTLPILLVIEAAVVNAHRGVEGAEVRDLKNAEIAESVENAIKNLQTEESGLIYEHHAASSRVEEVSRRIRAALDDFTKKAPDEYRPRRSDILKMLDVTRAAVEAHVRRGEEEDSYLRHISIYFPWPEEKTRPLII
ncbi:MAG TPA: hypothetical protein VJX74_07435 [Blastocatellia bacterium]|nr:hypothetical protein [Blastocatellia bacterium]